MYIGLYMMALPHFITEYHTITETPPGLPQNISINIYLFKNFYKKLSITETWYHLKNPLNIYIYVMTKIKKQHFSFEIWNSCRFTTKLEGWGESVAWGAYVWNFIQSAANLVQLFIWGLKHREKKIKFFFL